jgi:hypothetical protein
MHVVESLKDFGHHRKELIWLRFKPKSVGKFTDAVN